MYVKVRNLLDYIQRLEEETTEQQEQMEVYLKFEKEYDLVKSRARNLQDELKEIKFQYYQQNQEIGDLKQILLTKEDRVSTLQKRLDLEIEGKDILRERVDIDNEKEDNFKTREKELNQQIISQGIKM